MNGFANRFLWICAKRSQLLPHGGQDVDTSDLQERLTMAYEFASRTERLTRDPKADELWERLYKELAEESPGLVGVVTARAEAQIVRLSMLYALLDSCDVIREEHLKAAAALWDYAAQSARYIFGSSSGGTLADRVLTALQSHGPMSLTALHRQLGNHVSANSLRYTLASLEDAKRVSCTTNTGTGGRPADVWLAL